MTKSPKNNSKNDQDKAEEPEASYQIDENESKAITISSLEELEELNRAHTAKLSPRQRMEYLRKLNENLFGFDFSRQKAVLKKGEIIIRERS